MKYIITAFALCGLSSCATLNTEFVTQKEDSADYIKKAQGKTPREASILFGTPMSSGWRNKRFNGETEFFMAYPINDTKNSIKYSDLILGGDRMECRYFLFYQEKSFKFAEALGSSGNSYTASCEKIKNTNEFTYNNELIK